MKSRWSSTEQAEYVEEEENGVLGNDINPGGSDPRESKLDASNPRA